MDGLLEILALESEMLELKANPKRSATGVVLEARKSSPYEIGLGRLVALDRGPFVGREALGAEAAGGSAWSLVGLEVSWEALESLYESFSLPPNLPPRASREGLPVYLGDRQVGQATSHTWSPILKKYIALASVQSRHAAAGSTLDLEHTVEFERRRVPATIVETPFFNPERKRKP